MSRATVRPVLALLLSLLAATASAETLRVVGRANAGCIAGAEELPPRGPGFVEIHRAESHFWGHPETIAGVESLAREAMAAGLGEIYVGDLSPRHGGPQAGAHVSHQRGIDVDIWLAAGPRPPLAEAAAESITPPSLVRPDGRDVDPARFTPAIASLIRLATELPDVDRVLVNPAIKAHLCRTVGADRGWLHRLRPWWGHSAHMHLSFRCPADQPDCVQMPPPPPGDGCDGSLDWWFAQLGKPPAPARPAARPALPAFCRALLGAS
jgi:penicillin-insensitive murein DD-endopeptidase